MAFSPMKKTVSILLLCAVIAVGFLSYGYFRTETPVEKVYIAAEGDGKIVVVDPIKGKVLRSIDLSIAHEGGTFSFAPHNVQVSPDNRSVWVTANAGAHSDHSAWARSAFAHGDEESAADSGEKDEIIIIDPETDTVTERIPIGAGLHLAHVVLTPDSRRAYVTAQNAGVVFKVDAISHKVLKAIPIGEKSDEPHGIRITPDGAKAVIAMLKGKTLIVLDLATEKAEVIPTGGAGVQAGVTPDGTAAVVSLYDTKELALYRFGTKTLLKIPLPQSSRGPVQMYLTADSKFVYLADQGYYFGEPTSDLVYKIDLEKLEVVKEIKAGRAPHGVAISPDGARVYVTNLLSGDLSVIDTATDSEVKRIGVGKEPNGVSVWINNNGD